ncbi:MAG: hypothetical protein JO264_20410 [Acidisphaera sp.]|nr:hypothetical protein [Acidisphaera sp.]
MASYDSVRDKAADTNEQIAQLRKQVESLMSERVTPMLADAAGRAEAAARSVSDSAREQAEAVSVRVRERPIAAVLIAGAAGYLIGRIFR